MSRKKDREKTLELLFGIELSKDDPNEAISTFVDNFEGDIKTFNIEHIKEVVNGVVSKKDEIDKLIEDSLTNWKMDRISKINLSILRLGIYEMKYVEDVPDRVAINEALELTKRYSDEKSVSFINGVLDNILKG